MIADKELDEEAKDKIRQWAWDNYREGTEPKPYWHEIAREEWIRINNNRRRGTMYLTFYNDDLEDYSFDQSDIECSVEVNGRTVGSYNASLDDVGVDSVEVSIESVVSQLTSSQIPDDVRDEIKAAFDANNTELSVHATDWLCRFDNDSETASLEDKLRGAKARYLQLEEFHSHMAAVFRFLTSDAP